MTQIRLTSICPIKELLFHNFLLFIYLFVILLFVSLWLYNNRYLIYIYKVESTYLLNTGE